MCFCIFMCFYGIVDVFVNQVTKLVRANELTANDRELIFEAIGFKFLSRLLRTGNTFSLNNVYCSF